MTADAAEQVLRDYEATGFGYADYPGQRGDGLARAHPSHVLSLLEDFRVVSVIEHEYAGRQDVYAATFRPPDAGFEDSHRLSNPARCRTTRGGGATTTQAKRPAVVRGASEARLLRGAYGANTPWRANSVFGLVAATPSAPPSSTKTWPIPQIDRLPSLSGSRVVPDDRVERRRDRAGRAHVGIDRRGTRWRPRGTGMSTMVAGLLPPPPGPMALSRSVQAELVLCKVDLARVVLEVAAAADVRDRHRTPTSASSAGVAALPGWTATARTRWTVLDLPFASGCRPSAGSILFRRGARRECERWAVRPALATGSSCRPVPAAPVAASHPWAAGSRGADSPEPSCSPGQELRHGVLDHASERIGGLEHRQPQLEVLNRHVGLVV